jgi:hypothetical protein
LTPKKSKNPRPVGNTKVEKDKSLMEQIREYVTGEVILTELDRFRIEDDYLPKGIHRLKNNRF